MTDALRTIGYIQGGMQFDYMNGIDTSNPYFVLRSDGSIVRGEANSNAGVSQYPAPTTLGGQSHDAPGGEGKTLSGQAVAAIKDYLNRMYGLQVSDASAGMWLTRATRIDDATSSFEGFEDRLIQDIVQNEGGGDPAASEAALRQVLGDNYDDFVSRQKLSDPAKGIPEQISGSQSDAFSPGVQAGLTANLDGSGTGGASGGTYTVKAGDSLSAIAARYGTTVEALAQANGLTDPNLILVGATLKIPGAGGGDAGSAGAPPDASAGAGAAAAAGGVAASAGGGIGGDLASGSGGSAGSAQAGGTGVQVPQKAGVGPNGQVVTPDLLKRWLEDPDVGFYATFNAVVNSFRDAGASAVFVDWLAQQFTTFKGEYMGQQGQMALNGQVPSGTFAEFMSKISGGAIPPGPGAASYSKQSSDSSSPAQVSAPSTGGAVGPTPDPAVVAAVLPPDTAPVSPSLGETPGLAPVSPILQQYVLGQTA